MYAVSNDYNDVIYSGGARHRLSLQFKGNEVEDANSKVEYVKRKSNILSNGDERFSLDNFVSMELEIKIHGIRPEDVLEPVNVSIGTYVDDDYEYVPIGIFNLSEAPTKDGDIVTIKLRDNSVKFDVPYDAEPIIKANNNSATMLQILQDICNKCGVTLSTTNFINKDTEVSVWDNTINARQYVMWIAEKAASIATINRLGELILVPLDSNLTVFDLDTNLIESFTEGDRFVISRVVYEDGIRKFEYGQLASEDDVLYPSTELYPSSDIYPSDWNYLKQYTTLYIDSTNPYIVDTTEVENIYNSIKDFGVYGMKITKIIGNPALDAYDLIRFTYKGKTYTTFAQNEMIYNGVITQSFETNIGTLEKNQENVTVNTDEAKFKRVYTRINQVEGQIELNVSQTAENTALINSQGTQIESLGTIITQNISSINANVTSIQETLQNGVTLVKTISVTIDDNGLSVSTDNSRIATTMTNDAFKIVPKGSTEPLAFFGYDEEENTSKSEMDNLTVRNYFIAGNHRIEKYERNGEARTGHFYIG